MGDNLDEFIVKENFSVLPPDEFRSKLVGLVTPEQGEILFQRYQELYRFANGDYRRTQNS